MEQIEVVDCPDRTGLWMILRFSGGLLGISAAMRPYDVRFSCGENRREVLVLRFSGGEYERGHADADYERAHGARDKDGLLAFGRNLRRWGMNNL